MSTDKIIVAQKPRTGSTNLRDRAIRYAVFYGLHIHPLKPEDKTPATQNGLKDASNKDAQVTAWWTQSPQCNIGLNCGASGLVALDFDVNKPTFEGGDLLAHLLSEYPTAASETQSGGYHLIYWQPEGVKLGNSRGKLPCGVDVRGHGGYIVLPPSKLDPDLIDENKIGKTDKDGHTITLQEVEAKRDLYRPRPGYQWAAGKSIGEIEIAPLPLFVLDLIIKESESSEVTKQATTARANTPNRPLDDVIGEFNRATDIIALLEKCGYTLAWCKGDKARMIRPGGNSASVVVFLDGDKPVSYHHSTSDPLNSDHVRDAFDIYTQLEHSGDLAKAHEAAKRLQGKWIQSSQEVTAAILDKAIIVSETDEQPEDDNDINPLDVTPVKGLQLGWIDEYVDLMESLTASPREFHQLTGLITVASVLQRRAWLPMSFGNQYPNVYGCIIAQSTVYGKSTSINAPRRVLQSALMDKLLIPAQGSSEGLIKQLSLTPSALMIRDEIGTMFGSDKVKYLKDYKQDLTAIYDCMPYSRLLSSGEIKVDKPYLNILGATTPSRFYGNVNRGDWLDGFMPRWLYVQPEGEPNFENTTGMFRHDEAISKLAWRLMEIDREKETAFTLQGESYQMWATWRTNSLKLAYRQQDEIAMAIIGRYATYALKFSIILAAINNSWGTVSEATMQAAINLADHYKHNVNRILSEREKHEINGGKLQKVFLLLQRKGGGDGMTMRQITQLTNMSKTEVEPVLEKLISMAAVMSGDSVGGNGRPVKKFYAVAKELPIKHYA